jgi:hypothetical protein
MTEELYSVFQFFTDGSYEKVREFVPAQQAVEAFKHYSTSVGARCGIVERVIITDSGDCTNLEWRLGRGYSHDGEHYAETAHTDAHPHLKG